MSIIGSNILAGASGQAGYNLNNSLRFRQSAIGYLSRTPAGATNRKTFTWSGWIKLGFLSQYGVQFAAGDNNFTLKLASAGGSSNSLEVYDYNGASYNFQLVSSAVYRDSSAWYHLVVSIDTTQATASNRVKIYVNGNQVTSFSTSTYPSQNLDTYVNSVTPHYHGVFGSSYLTSAYAFDGYMTEINFVDGTALTPSSFGETSATTGQWIPKKYTGTYGTNGFYLKFADIATTSGSNAGLGKDFSGNGNYFNTNNISVTAGTTYDAMTDVPTNTSATVANYAVMNPVGIIKTTSASLATFAGANLNVSGGAAWFYAYSSIAIPIGSGKYYAEFTINTSGGSDYIAVGINPVVGSFGATAHSSSEGGVWYSNNATKWLGSTNSAYGASYTAGDIIGVAVDSGASTITFYKNNTSQTSISFNSNLTSNTFALLGVDMYNSSISANFGQQPFTYTPPSGYVALNTYNLPTPTILQGNKYMDATLYTGTGANGNVITNTAGFKPDFVWTKSRANAYSSNLYNSISGVNKYLQSNNTGAEASVADTLTSFNTNGFTVGAQDNANYTNGSAGVGWQWQAGQGSTSSNTNGTITSTVSVNATAGFSVVTYTGTGSNATVGHGLGVAPAMMIVKNRSSGSDNWTIYQKAISSTPQNDYMFFTTAAKASASTVWQNTAPTPSVFYIGTSGTVNTNTNNFVAYCWAEIAGFSKFGSYTGNNSTDGPFVYLGFRPKFVLIKRTDAGENWSLIDSARVTYNVNNLGLFPSLANAESANLGLDLLSNGFKFRTDGTTNGNASGGTYIYMAFAENPFKNANAR